MCGIAGIFNFDGKKVKEKILHQMNELMVHRGPDGSGEFIKDNIGLANRRLMIIDLTPMGRQPMGTKDGSLWITFNGEIFNYKELKEELISKGYKFFSNTDTEVILNGYKHYGENIVNKLLGQFAFCIWDKNKKRFFLTRDNLGINPLFYAKVGNTFLFASEVKAVLGSGLVRKDLNLEAFHHFLSVFHIPAPLTIFKEIKALLPGQMLFVDKQGIKIKKFWELPVGMWKNEKLEKEEIKERLKELVISSVSYAKIADVPIGVFLSGGIDSSTITAILSQQTSKRVKTFNLWSEGGENYDERKFARIIAKKYGTDHQEFTLTQEEIIKEFPKIIYYIDQPRGELLENYFVSKYAGKEVKVVLSGLGGDELFGGYHGIIYENLIFSSLYRVIPKEIREFLVKTLNLLPFSLNFKKTINTGDKFFSTRSAFEKLLFLYFAFKEKEKKEIYAKNIFHQIKKVNTESYFKKIYSQVKNFPLIDQFYYLDSKTITRDDMLLGMNILTMANSLEGRVPLLDKRLVEFSALIPPQLKYHRGISKFILKEVFKEWLPIEIIKHKKTGFGMPRPKYMREKLKPFILSVLSKESIKKRGILNPDYIQNNVLDKFYNDNSTKAVWSEHLKVWMLFVFELWCRIYLDQRIIKVPNVSLSDLS